MVKRGYIKNRFITPVCCDRLLQISPILMFLVISPFDSAQGEETTVHKKHSTAKLHAERSRSMKCVGI